MLLAVVALAVLLVLAPRSGIRHGPALSVVLLLRVGLLRLVGGNYETPAQNGRVASPRRPQSRDIGLQFTVDGGPLGERALPVSPYARFADAPNLEVRF